MKTIFIKTDNNDAYMNTVANFRGAVHGTDTGVDLYFEAAASVGGGGAFDKISLVCVSESEQEVMASISGALTGSHSKAMVVIADDIGKKYVNANIASVGAIDLAVTATTQVENVLIKTDDYQITAADSGSTIVINDTNAILTLPTCAAGLKYKIICGQDTATAKIVAGASDCFFGTVYLATTTINVPMGVNQSVPLATTSLNEVVLTHDAATLGGKAGDVVYITGVNAVSWHVDAVLLTDHADPTTVATIV
tara:strand:+ start:115 stop:870 length:756 start_codon:yes stop_codon:yes gene_type:complete